MYLFRRSVVNLGFVTNINYTLKAIDTLMTSLGVRIEEEKQAYISIQFSTEKRLRKIILVKRALITLYFKLSNVLYI